MAANINSRTLLDSYQDQESLGSYLPPDIDRQIGILAVSRESSVSEIVSGICKVGLFCYQSKLTDEQTRTFVCRAIDPRAATKSIDETSVIMHAAFKGNFLAVATLLLYFPVDLTEKDTKGRTPLALASMGYAMWAGTTKSKSYIRIIKALCPKSEVNTRDFASETPLHLICESLSEASAEGIKMLLEHGAEVNAQNNLKETPCHLLAANGNIAGLNALKPYKPNLNAISIVGNYCRPLDYAALLDQSKAISWLYKDLYVDDSAITVGALRDNGIHDYPAPAGCLKSMLWKFKTIRESSYALRLAVKCGNTESVKVLLSGPTDGFIKFETSSASSRSYMEGQNALHVAVLCNRKFLVRDLMKRVDINEKTDDGETALAIAKRLGHKEIFHDLLVAGAEL